MLSRLEANLVKVTLTFQMEEQVQQDDWKLNLVPSFVSDYHWAPHLTPTDQHIIDQHSFRSPALMVKNNQQLLILIPDLDLLQKNTGVRWYMDNDASRNLLTLGMSEYEVKEHVLYVRRSGAAYSVGEVKVGFYLMTYEEPLVLANPWRPVLHFLWNNWGSSLFQAGAPLDLPLTDLVHHTYRWAFENWGEQVWQEFELDGKEVGTSSFIVNVTQSPNYSGTVNEREFRSIWNQVWFNSLRSASGVYRYGLESNKPSMIRRANLTKELALSAPQRDGIFPTVIATEMEQIEVESEKVNRSKGWGTAYWGNSNRNPSH